MCLTIEWLDPFYQGPVFVPVFSGQYFLEAHYWQKGRQFCTQFLHQFFVSVIPQSCICLISSAILLCSVFFCIYLIKYHDELLSSLGFWANTTYKLGVGFINYCIDRNELFYCLICFVLLWSYNYERCVWWYFVDYRWCSAYTCIKERHHGELSGNLEKNWKSIIVR